MTQMLYTVQIIGETGAVEKVRDTALAVLCDFGEVGPYGDDTVVFSGPEETGATLLAFFVVASSGDICDGVEEIRMCVRDEENEGYASAFLFANETVAELETGGVYFLDFETAVAVEAFIEGRMGFAEFAGGVAGLCFHEDYLDVQDADIERASLFLLLAKAVGDGKGEPLPAVVAATLLLRLEADQANRAEDPFFDQVLGKSLDAAEPLLGFLAGHAPRPRRGEDGFFASVLCETPDVPAPIRGLLKAAAAEGDLK
jgi:hypothetical protein